MTRQASCAGRLAFGLGAMREAVEGLRTLPPRGTHPEAFASHFERVLIAASTLVDGGATVADVSNELEPVRRLVSQSALVRRLQTWPRGYQGDFETIDRIVARRNSERPGTLAYAAEQWTLDCGPSQQHRNKVGIQATLIRDAIERAPTARVLSIASGPNCDVRLIGREVAATGCTLVLNDADADAIAFTRSQLSPALAKRCSWIAGNAFTRVRQISEEGPYDLVLIGGLFDDLTDRQCAWLLRQLLKVLAPSGLLFFTNMASGNPFRLCMEEVTAWNLRERSEAVIRALVGNADQKASVSISRDSTSLALLATLALR